MFKDCKLEEWKNIKIQKYHVIIKSFVTQSYSNIV